MKLETKKQITSLALTFLATFLATLAVGLENLSVESLEVSAFVSISVTALRAGLKVLFLKFIEYHGS